MLKIIETQMRKNFDLNALISCKLPHRHIIYKQRGSDSFYAELTEDASEADLRDLENFSYANKQLPLNMVSMYKVLHSHSTTCMALSSTLVNYINELGTLKCKPNDYIPVGTHFIYFKYNGHDMVIGVERCGDIVFTSGSSVNGKIDTLSALDVGTNMSENIDGNVNDSGHFDTLSFTVKFFQCYSEGICLHDSIKTTNIMSAKKTSKKRNHKPTTTTQRVHYISLSKIGHDRLNASKTSRENNKAVYKKGSWWRRPYLRNVNDKLQYVRGSWCFRKCDTVNNDVEVKTVYTV